MHRGSTPYIEISPVDAERLKVVTGSPVRVTSRSGSITVGALVTERVAPGEVFMPLHYAEAAANALTDDAALDPHSKTPRFKISYVRIEPLSKETNHD